MADAAEKKLYTLTEVSKLTKVSMPTLQRYKKLYQDRIPSVGEGRKQRYPEEALDVFRQLKEENVSRRGRPRKTAAKSASKPKAKTKAKATRRQTKSKRGRKSAPKKTAAQGKDELLTLTQISKITGISYPTLLRYVKSHLDKIPHKGTGRARRYKPEAVEVFKHLRSQSRRGRKAGSAKTAKKSAAAKPRKTARKTAKGRRTTRAASSGGDSAALLKRIKELEKSHKKLERMIAKQQKQIEKPYRVVLQRK